MNTITITYSLIWQFKNCKHYQVSKCKRVFNTRTNREIKSSLNGGSIGFWIGKRFVTKKQLNNQLQKIKKETLPF